MRLKINGLKKASILILLLSVGACSHENINISDDNSLSQPTSSNNCNIREYDINTCNGEDVILAATNAAFTFIRSDIDFQNQWQFKKNLFSDDFIKMKTPIGLFSPEATANTAYVLIGEKGYYFKPNVKIVREDTPPTSDNYISRKVIVENLLYNNKNQLVSTKNSITTNTLLVVAQRENPSKPYKITEMRFI